MNMQVAAWASIEQENTVLAPGGRYKPTTCQARHRVAVIIPYRDREIHLKIFLRNIHPFLQRQQLDYGIFVVELVRIEKLYDKDTAILKLRISSLTGNVIT